jgi:hypothetical protein
MSFGKDARNRQAKFRPSLSAAAQNPSDPKGQRYGHLLALGCETENLMPCLRGSDGALKFFGDRGIKWWKSVRSGDDIKAVGPTRNLASSQVACVNFLLPLADFPGALAASLRAIDPDVAGVVPITCGTLASPVEFEWVGWNAPLEGGRITRGANQTSADALVVAEVPGGRRAYVFEWKYCEEYLRPEDKGTGKSGDTRRYRYCVRYHAAGSSFTGAVPLDDFLFEPYYQLMRLRLLADRMVDEGVTAALRVDEARVVVACPEANQEYRKAIPSTPLARRFPHVGTVEGLMRATLKDPSGIAVVAPESLVGALRAAVLGPAIRPWLEYHQARYGW